MQGKNTGKKETETERGKDGETSTLFVLESVMLVKRSGE